MFLSVSIPIYNAEKYLDRSIESVMKQNMRDFELLLVNDGSKDNSLEICYKWQALYPNTIRIIDKSNTGSLFTRRVCITESKGDYLYIMDADDYLLEDDAFLHFKTMIENTNCDLLLFNSTTTIEKNKYCEFNFNDGQVFEGSELNEIYTVLASGDKLNALWDKVFSKDLIDWNFKYEDYPYVTNGTDMFQIIPIIMTAKRIAYSDRVLYFYQLQNNGLSIIHSYNPNMYKSLKANYLRLYDSIKEKGFLSNDLKRILAVRYMKISSTAAFKIRLAGGLDKKEKKSYLETISRDKTFRKYYEEADLRELEITRRIIVQLLYYRCINILLLLFKFFS